MPDFTTIMMQQCTVNEARIGGYHQTHLYDENHWPRCTCLSYRFMKPGYTFFAGRRVSLPCKHLEEAKDTCGWHQMSGPEAQEKEGICPRCGAETMTVEVAV